MPIEFHADFAINHLGNLNLLLRMTEKAKWAGCDYVKIQHKDINSFYSLDKLNKRISEMLPYGKLYGEYRSMFEFDYNQLVLFDDYCKKIKMKWYATIQDIPSIYLFLKFNLDKYKVPSCDARNKPFLQIINSELPDDKEIVISVAGSTLKEIEESLNFFNGRKIYLLHCVAEYPCFVEDLRLGNIEVLKKEFESDKIVIGYSGHEEGIEASLAAYDLGAEIINRHFSILRHNLLERVECSLEPEEFKTLIDLIKDGCYEYSLSPKAYESWFGMTKDEKQFLKDQEYKGVKYAAK